LNTLLLSNIPNLITLARVLAVPLIVWLILNDKLFAAFWVFFAAGVSDALDGFIAKKYNWQTVLGAFLDPLADKALLMSAYITLGYKDTIATWLVILVVFRDLVIIGGAMVFQAVTQTLQMEPLMISKANTLAQILLIGVLLGGLGLGLEAETVAAQQILTYIVAATTIASGAAYVYKWGRKASDMERDGQ